MEDAEEEREEEQPEEEQRRVIVRGLDLTVTDFVLRKEFGKCGPVSKVERMIPEGASKAIESFNGKTIRGKKIQVKFPDNPPPTPPPPQLSAPTLKAPYNRSRRDWEYRKEMMNVNQKVQPKRVVTSTIAKIQAIEEKLKELSGEKIEGEKDEHIGKRRKKDS
ncbi:hypothetical protein HDU97_008368 [Phlyctochytrium planicorne]|nr:hypothetical protein HDU97_008368 [Phlyctochytrium planicorne]